MYNTIQFSWKNILILIRWPGLQHLWSSYFSNVFNNVSNFSLTQIVDPLFMVLREIVIKLNRYVVVEMSIYVCVCWTVCVIKKHLCHLKILRWSHLFRGYTHITWLHSPIRRVINKTQTTRYNGRWLWTVSCLQINHLSLLLVSLPVLPALPAPSYNL